MHYTNCSSAENGYRLNIRKDEGNGRNIHIAYIEQIRDESAFIMLNEMLQNAGIPLRG